MVGRMCVRLFVRANANTDETQAAMRYVYVSCPRNIVNDSSLAAVGYNFDIAGVRNPIVDVMRVLPKRPKSPYEVYGPFDPLRRPRSLEIPVTRSREAGAILRRPLNVRCMGQNWTVWFGSRGGSSTRVHH